MLVFLGGVANIYPNLSDGAKKYQLAFLVPLLGIDSVSILSDCTKKRQQAFLALLSGMDSISILGDCANNASIPQILPGESYNDNSVRLWNLSVCVKKYQQAF